MGGPRLCNRLYKSISTGGCHKPTASANVTFTLAVAFMTTACENGFPRRLSYDNHRCKCDICTGGWIMTTACGYKIQPPVMFLVYIPLIPLWAELFIVATFHWRAFWRSRSLKIKEEGFWSWFFRGRLIRKVSLCPCTIVLFILT
jgi:hypothetical protein